MGAKQSHSPQNPPLTTHTHPPNDPRTHTPTQFPIPTGQEYDLIDNLISNLPSIIDPETQQQVEDYIQACDHGKGPMVSCFSTAEYLSLFLRKHTEAETLYRNACFRPLSDRSPNGVQVGDTKAYPPACFNLAQMRMTGKGGTFNRQEGYELFERACEAEHGGSCHMLAKMLTSEPGSLGEGVPYDPPRAAGLLEKICDDGDSRSCFMLATMLLRGNDIHNEADNVSALEAKGETVIVKRDHEEDRRKRVGDARVALKRNPRKAEELLIRSCEEQLHAPSCYNLAVMYRQGDEGIECDEEKAEEYRVKTEDLVDKFGGFGM